MVAPSDDFGSLPVISRQLIDLSTGRVSGERAQYFIDFTSLPGDWTSDVVAQRELIGIDSPVIERVEFYVRSYTRPTRDFLQLMFAIYVIDRHSIDEEDIPYAVVSRSRDYVFAVRYGLGNFANVNDRTYHALKMHPMDTPIKMRRFITFPPNQRPDYRNTVFADGIPLNAPNRNIGGIYYVQLREAAEIMGYTVRWNANTNTVSVSRGTFIDTFRITADTTHDHRGIHIRLIDDRTYVSTVYFAEILHKNFSFDASTVNISIF
jgi:hypothetical protein